MWHRFAHYAVYTQRRNGVSVQAASCWTAHGKQMQMEASEEAAAPCRHGALLPRRRHGYSGVTCDEVTSQ
ncbi:hypothetical protein PBY51_006441 [Eleginops maclovinus]|uniref:Uncharacterized protein n=1 Tax=Eleginops maclovinus TaxID=56733 RepID=A0AAN7WVV0_ELEMC|nr:hypothetical protein PBY51_006441 [Eleginops maclovinus]